MRVPSYRALCVFCRLTEYMSIKRTANELNVSPSSVSHLIKSLENVLEISLFEKSGAKLKLAVGGRKLRDSVCAEFESIDRALRAFRPAQENELRITTTPSFFTCWLSTNLSKFTQLYPEIRVEIVGTTHKANISKEAWDLAIRWIDSDSNLPDDLSSEQLWKEEFGCFTSHSWQERVAGLSFNDFAKMPKVHAIAFPHQWQDWSNKYSGETLDNLAIGCQVESRASVFQSVLAGVGSGILDARLVKSQVESGQLYEPFEFRNTVESGYWLLSDPNKRETKQCRLFKQWLLSETETSRKDNPKYSDVDFSSSVEFYQLYTEKWIDSICLSSQQGRDLKLWRRI